MVTGWVVADEAPALEAALRPLADDIDLTLDEPGEGDTPPVRLATTRSRARSRSSPTSTAGPVRRARSHADARPVLPASSSASASRDVGYGAMLIGGAWLIKHRIDVAPGVKRFHGPAHRGRRRARWFRRAVRLVLRDPVDKLPPFLQSLQVLDPLTRAHDVPRSSAIALGVIQVFFGVLIAAYDACRRRRPGRRPSSSNSRSFFMFAMIAVAVFVPDAARWLLLVGRPRRHDAHAGRALSSQRSATGRPLWDRAVGWASAGSRHAGVDRHDGRRDTSQPGWHRAALVRGQHVVSKTGTRRRSLALLGGAYARLRHERVPRRHPLLHAPRGARPVRRAGGLGVQHPGRARDGPLRAACSSRAALPSSAESSSSSLAATVFVFGHTFNVVINLLGAFVHPARLQFVEFFSKFYEGGGSPFDPFRYRTKSVCSAGECRPEGGAGSDMEDLFWGMSGTAWALIGGGTAAILGGIGSAIGITVAARPSPASCPRTTSKFGKLLPIAAMPGTQGIYGFIAAVLVLDLLRDPRRPNIELPAARGLQGVPRLSAGGVALLSSQRHYQGKTGAAAAGIVARRSEDRARRSSSPPSSRRTRCSRSSSRS